MRESTNVVVKGKRKTEKRQIKEKKKEGRGEKQEIQNQISAHKIERYRSKCTVQSVSGRDIISPFEFIDILIWHNNSSNRKKKKKGKDVEIAPFSREKKRTDNNSTHNSSYEKESSTHHCIL